jgi:hypothetical protein
MAGTSSCASDTCPFSTGVSWQCKKRFMYGVNFAWRELPAATSAATPNQRGVAQNTSAHRPKLAKLAENGVSVIRWWCGPTAAATAVTFSGTEPTGLGSTTSPISRRR